MYLSADELRTDEILRYTRRLLGNQYLTVDKQRKSMEIWLRARLGLDVSSCDKTVYQKIQRLPFFQSGSVGRSANELRKQTKTP